MKTPLLVLVILLLTGCFIDRQNNERVPDEVKFEWRKMNKEMDDKIYYHLKIKGNRSSLLDISRYSEDYFYVYWNGTEVERYHIRNICPDESKHWIVDTLYVADTSSTISVVYYINERIPD